jgi:ankyrin repeat protein
MVLMLLRSPTSRPYTHEVNAGFIEACRNDAANIVEVFLLELWIDVERAGDAKTLQTGFLAASASGAVKATELLLKSPRTDILARDRQGRTALLLASFHGHPSTASLLLSDPRTDLHARDSNLDTAFTLACSQNHVPVISLLLSTGKIDLMARNAGGKSGLELASKETRVLVRGALAAQNYGMLIEEEKKGWSRGGSDAAWLRTRGELSEAVADLGQLARTATAARDAKELVVGLEEVADGVTEGDVKSAKTVAELEPEPIDSAEAEDVSTPWTTTSKTITESISSKLTYASYAGFLPLVQELLLDPRADPNFTAPRISKGKQMGTWNPLSAAIHGGNEEIVRVLLADPRTRPNEPIMMPGRYKTPVTPLWLAITQSHPTIVSLLLDHPAVDPNAPQEFHKHTTALMSSTRLQPSSRRAPAAIETIATLLLHPKVDPNIQDSGGRTALHSWYPRILAVVPLFLQHAESRGIDLSLRTKSGWRAVDTWRVAAKGTGKELEEWIGREGWEVLAEA